MIAPSEKQLASLRIAGKSYHEQLWADDEALNYLMTVRRFTKEAIAHFGLGVVREPELGHETFRNRISFPYITVGGVTSIRFRYLGDPVPDSFSKFIALTGDSARIYNVTAILDQEKVFVCEGESDTITAWMARLPAVGIPGVRAWKPAFSRVLRNREVVVLADNDDDGQGKAFADEVYRALEGCDVILMPKGHDVTSFVAAEGLQKLREKVGLGEEG